MSLTFPSNPTLGDTYTAASNTWYWDGVKWRTQGDQGIIGPSGTTGSAGNDLPKITGVTYADNTYTSNGASSIAPSTAGYIYLTGSNFQSGCKVYVNGTLMTTTYVSGTRVNVAITGQSAASYHIYFYNPDGGTTVKANGLSILTPTTGGTITNSGGYTIHTFTSSDTFVLGSNKTVDYLVVAGGGGGGGIANDVSSVGGGGGAGGVIYNTSQSMTAGSYTITVGAGGGIRSNGNNSIINTISTATGGGSGGTGTTSSGGTNGSNGGSGGGAGLNSGYGSGTYGTGTSGQGNRGGSTAVDQAGGGGGAGAVGNPGLGSPDYRGGVGGVGRQISISGSAVYYGGGGMGGSANPGPTSYTGALGGGGGMGQYYIPQSGTANTGGGGTGTIIGRNYNPGTGGSGIVIIRYLT